MQVSRHPQLSVSVRQVPLPTPLSGTQRARGSVAIHPADEVAASPQRSLLAGDAVSLPKPQQYGTTMV
jgi:hypothetical protein